MKFSAILHIDTLKLYMKEIPNEVIEVIRDFNIYVGKNLDDLILIKSFEHAKELTYETI